MCKGRTIQEQLPARSCTRRLTAPLDGIFSLKAKIQSILEGSLPFLNTYITPVCTVVKTTIVYAQAPDLLFLQSSLDPAFVNSRVHLIRAKLDGGLQL
jgi:hypothetical protein